MGDVDVNTLMMMIYIYYDEVSVTKNDHFLSTQAERRRRKAGHLLGLSGRCRPAWPSDDDDDDGAMEILSMAPPIPVLRQ